MVNKNTVILILLGIVWILTGWLTVVYAKTEVFDVGGVAITVPNNEDITILGLSGEPMETATQFFTYYCHGAEYEGKEVLVYVLIDHVKKKSIAFIITWMGKTTEGEPMSYARYYFMVPEKPVLTNLDGLRRMIDIYKLKWRD
jgi:hypothetical protein